MRKTFFSAVLISSLAAGCSPKPAPVDHTKAFQGTWQTVGTNRNGNKVVAVFEKDQFQINEIQDTAAVQTISLSGGTEKGQFQLNAAATPPQIDLVYLDGDNQGKSRPGIYAVENDQIKMCLAAVGEARPTEFAEKENVSLMVFERKP
jgi:uncharacterized protein (TIGR03067 family)